MLQSARPQICHLENRPALRQPGSTTVMPGHCSGAAYRFRRHVAPNSSQLQYASLRSAVAQQIRAQPVAAPEVALPQVQPPRLPLGFSLAAYPSLAGRNVLVTGVYDEPHPHLKFLHLNMLELAAKLHTSPIPPPLPMWVCSSVLAVAHRQRPRHRLPHRAAAGAHGG
jgi:hypothetical protein